MKEDGMTDAGAGRCVAAAGRELKRGQRTSGAVLTFATIPVMFALLVSLCAGTAGSARAEECVHPYPCEGDWPVGLEGPFDFEEVRFVSIPMSDGIELEAWIAMPALPDDVRAPLALLATPYINWCYAHGPYCGSSPGYGGDTGGYWSGGDFMRATGVYAEDLVRAGFATAAVSLRGTGNSQGCSTPGSARRDPSRRRRDIGIFAG